MGRSQRQKGKRGEREFSKAAAAATGLSFRRTQQYNGEGNSDVVCADLPGIHWEVKRCEKLSIYEAMQQAAEDSGSQLPVVGHRRNGKEWLVVVSLSDLKEFCHAICKAT